MTDTIAALVARHARERPDGIAFVEVASGETMTWREYDERSSRMAGALGVAYAPGDRVALQLPDGPGVHTTMLACEKAGHRRGRHRLARAASARSRTSSSAPARARC